MSRIKHIKQYPAAFQSEAMKINEIIDQLNPILAAVGGGSVKITKAGDNWIISSTGGTGGTGDGLPAGYTFEEFTICDSGTPATRWLPTWTTNPEA